MSKINPLVFKTGTREFLRFSKKSVTKEQFNNYRNELKKTTNSWGISNEDDLLEYYLDRRTYQFSDHRPLWGRLKINDGLEYLERLKSESWRGADTRVDLRRSRVRPLQS